MPRAGFDPLPADDQYYYWMLQQTKPPRLAQHSITLEFSDGKTEQIKKEKWSNNSWGSNERDKQGSTKINFTK